MGITQPLLYRYFPSKEALIERVYAEVFSNRWQPLWERGMGDPATPAAERLTLFYQDYARAVLSYEWVRLLMFGGLKGSELTTRYARLVFERVFPLVIEQVRLVHGKPPLDEAPMTEGESERLWTLHASIAYVGIRRWIYGLPVPADQDSAVADLVATFLLGGRPW